MLSWFGKGKEASAEKLWIDRVYVHTAGKNAGIISLAKAEETIVFVAWFSESLQKFRLLFAAENLAEDRVQLASTLGEHNSNANFVFVEHYPLHANELAFQQRSRQLSIVVFSAMDEPLFKYFGSDNMIPLIKLLGMKESEAIEHSYVTQAITRGQEKIAAQVLIDLSASSQSDWMAKHLPPRKA